MNAWHKTALLAQAALWTTLLWSSAAQAETPDKRCIWVLGDSLASALASELDYLLPDRRILNDGFGGQAPAPIAARAGAMPISATLVEGYLSGSGTTNLAGLNPEILTNSSPSRPEASIKGELQGIPGTLVWRRNQGYSFATSAPGSDIRLGAAARFVPFLSEKSGCLMVLWAGRNGAQADAGKALAGVAAIATMRRRMNQPVLILTVHNTPKEGRGTPAYDNIRRFDDELLRRYPESVIDIRKWLIDRARAEGAPVDTQSQQALGEDSVPAAFLADGLHPNKQTMRQIGETVVTEIRRRGL